MLVWSTWLYGDLNQCVCSFVESSTALKNCINFAKKFQDCILVCMQLLFVSVRVASM